MKKLIYPSKLQYALLLLFFFLSLTNSYARIYESPYSAEVIGMPDADNEPSITTITISQPQVNIGDNLYISNQTLIIFSAIDYGIVPSGVNYTEYKIDSESSWTRYTSPFNLSAYADGQHIIYYRSIDKMQNTEQEKTATIILDKIPPSTSITASDPLTEGVINIIAPRTRFTISSSDNLSGVKQIQYSIDGGSWQDYISNFSLSGMNAGQHTITYKAADNLGNEEAEKTLTIRLINLDVLKEISSEPVVLAAAWYLKEHEHKDDAEDREGHDDKDKDMKDKYNALSKLANMLSASGTAYYIPQNNDDFKETLRSGRFNTYIFVDFEYEQLDKEIKEAVYYGNGMVFIKTHPDENPRFEDVFGVKFHGESSHKGMTIDLLQSPISNAGTLETGRHDKAIETEITSDTAQAFGYITEKKDTYPAIVYNQYGRGKAVLFSFNLLNCPDSQKAKDLLMSSISFVAPEGHYIRAMADEPLSINLQNSSEQVDIQVTETIPSGTSPDSIMPDAVISGNTISWQISLNPNESRKLSYYLMLPDRRGDYTTNTELRYSSNGDYRLYGNYSLSMTIAQNSAELLQGLINDLNNLRLQTKKNREDIKEAIEELREINQNASKRKSAEKNIERILEAIKELKETSSDINDIRLKLDELLRVWQRKWTQLPEVKKY